MGIRIMVVKRKSEKLFLLIFGIKTSEPRFNCEPLDGIKLYTTIRNFKTLTEGHELESA